MHITLRATDYWLRFEWQHHSSFHMHGIACLPNAPYAKCLTSSHQDDAVKARIIQHPDKLVSTMNLGILPDSSNIDDAPIVKTDPPISAINHTVKQLILSKISLI